MTEVRAHRLGQMTTGLLIVCCVVSVGGAPAVASGLSLVLAQETPTELPEAETETPGWLEPLAPLAGLPIWAQAAVLAVVLAAVGFVVVVVIRAIWGSASRRHQYRSVR